VTTPLLEVGQPVLVSAAAEEPSWEMVVDLVQDGHITLASSGDEELPREWRDLTEVHLTCLGRYSVFLIHVPVLRTGETRLVISAPTEKSKVQRRAYARVLHHVPVSCIELDPSSNTWSAFEAEVRDLGGGGCSVLTDRTPQKGATVVMSFALDEDTPFAAICRVLPREQLPTIGKPLTRVEFVLIRESDRDRIMRFVLFSLARHRRAELRPE